MTVENLQRTANQQIAGLSRDCTACITSGAGQFECARVPDPRNILVLSVFHLQHSQTSILILPSHRIVY